MSLILDALTRAERDKRRGAVSVPDLLDAAPLEPTGLSRHTLWTVAGIVLCLLLLAATFWIWRPWTYSSDVPAPPAVERTVPSASPLVTVSPAADPEMGAPDRSARVSPAVDAQAPLSTPISESSPAAPIAAPPRLAVAPLPDAVTPAVQGADDGEDLLPADLVEDLQDALLEMDDAERAEIAALYASLGDSLKAAPEEPPPTPSTTAPQYEDTVDLAAAVREMRKLREEKRPLQEHPVPVLASLSKQFRDRVPSLMYLRHNYDSGGDSTLVINGQTLRVGQRTRNVEVVEILSDSAILRFEGTEFRLRALNSWVNL